MTIYKSHSPGIYFNSTTAHRNYPDKKITKADAIVAETGSLEGSNHRCINKMLVSQVFVASLSIVSCSESDGTEDPYANWEERIRVMNITLGELKPGEYRKVTEAEIQKLYELIKDSSNETVIQKKQEQ